MSENKKSSKNSKNSVKSFKLIMLNGESSSEFKERLKFYNFICSEEIKYPVKICKIWANIKYRQCRYSPSLYHMIMDLDKKFKN